MGSLECCPTTGTGAVRRTTFCIPITAEKLLLAGDGLEIDSPFTADGASDSATP